MTFTDPRLAFALKDDAGARAMLNELHNQIVVCPSTAMLGPLLARYTVVAAARQSQLAGPSIAVRSAFRAPAAGMQMESRHATTMSSIIKAVHDTQMSIINNMKA